jgi:hypothetical protein
MLLAAASLPVHDPIDVRHAAAFADPLSIGEFIIQRDVQLAGYERVRVNDPFGSRIELMERIA